MITADQIPDEVVVAFEEAYWNQEMTVAEAIVAVIYAWPGANVFPGMQRGFKETPPFITLPLPQKEGDA